MPIDLYVRQPRVLPNGTGKVTFREHDFIRRMHRPWLAAHFYLQQRNTFLIVVGLLARLRCWYNSTRIFFPRKEPLHMDICFAFAKQCIRIDHITPCICTPLTSRGLSTPTAIVSQVCGRSFFFAIGGRGGRGGGERGYSADDDKAWGGSGDAAASSGRPRLKLAARSTTASSSRAASSSGKSDPFGGARARNSGESEYDKRQKAKREAEAAAKKMEALSVEGGDSK